MIYVVAAIAGIAGLLFGFDEGVIAGALGLLRAQFGITPLDEGLITAAVPFGALFGAILAGWLAKPAGRRSLLLFAAVLFVAGALFAALAHAAWVLGIARLVLGFAIGIAAMIAPLYISESVPAARRGMLVSIYQLAITLGILGAYLVGYAFSDSWRTMFAVGMIPGLALFVGMMFMTDTPRWLAMRGRRDEALATLAKVRGVPKTDPAASAELAEIVRTAATDSQDDKGKLAELFGPVARPALIVGMGLFLLQQLSGINAVIYYAPTVFQLAGFDSTEIQILATAGIGVVNVLMTLVGMALIDRIGRRRLLYAGFAGAAVSLGVIAIAAASGSPDLGILALIGLVLYIASFAASIGPLPWVMMSEIFPLNVRGPGMSFASLANWGFNFVVVFSFPVLVADIGLAGVFGIYAVVCVAGLVFTRLYVPETNGVPLEDIERHLQSGRPFRDLAPAAGPRSQARAS